MPPLKGRVHGLQGGLALPLLDGLFQKAYVINTCSVTAAGDQKSRQAVRAHRAPGIGDDAVGAEVGAAVLHLQKGPGPALQPPGGEPFKKLLSRGLAQTGRFQYNRACQAIIANNLTKRKENLIHYESRGGARPARRR